MPRPRKKGEYVEEKARAKARLDAETEHTAKLLKNSKNIKSFLFSKVGKWVENLDVMEVGAIITGTYLVHNVLMKADDFVAAYEAWLVKPTATEQLITWGPIWGAMNYLLSYFVSKDVEPAIATLQENQAVVWAISFFIAYLFVKHFGLIVESIATMSGNLIGFGRMMLTGKIV